MTSGYSGPGGPYEGQDDGEDARRWSSPHRDRWPPVAGHADPSGQRTAGQRTAGQRWPQAPGAGQQAQPGAHPYQQGDQHSGEHPQGNPAYGGQGGYQTGGYPTGGYPSGGYPDQGVYGNAYGNGRGSAFGDPAVQGGQHGNVYGQPGGPLGAYQPGPAQAHPAADPGLQAQWPDYPADQAGYIPGSQGGNFHDSGNRDQGAPPGWTDSSAPGWQQRPGDHSNPQQWPYDIAITGQHVFNTDAFAVPGDRLRAAQRRPGAGGARVRRVWPQRLALIGVIIVAMVVCWYWIFPTLENLLPSEF
jgi:hypothetical protein